MTIEEILTHIWNYFTNFWNSVLNFFVQLWQFFSSISDVIITVSSYIISIFWFIFHALKTLIVWVWNLIIYIVDSDVWFNSIGALTYVSDYIWFPAVMFIISVVLLAITRIIAWFILKLIRWQDRYTTHLKKVDEASKKAYFDSFKSKQITLFKDEDTWFEE